MIEHYNQYGEIIPEPAPTVIFDRRLSQDQQHVIHRTKDLYESNCSYCQADQAAYEREHL